MIHFLLQIRCKYTILKKKIEIRFGKFLVMYCIAVHRPLHHPRSSVHAAVVRCNYTAELEERGVAAGLIKGGQLRSRPREPWSNGLVPVIVVPFVP